MSAISSLVLLAAVALGELPVVESKQFAREVQHTVLCATVRIINKTQPNEGSGVIVRQQGGLVYLLTANHLVGKAETVDVETFSARSYPKPDKVYSAVQVIARAREPDLALLRLATRDPMPATLPLCPAERCPVGKDLPGLTGGIQQGQPPTCWPDTILGKKLVRKPGGESCHVWELKREPAGGRSGGPLVEPRGTLIGILSGRSDGKGYYTHLDEIYRFLKQNDATRLLTNAKD
jgi:hypothetical protein